MSTIKASKHQIGSDPTPANNIVLTASNGDLIVNQGVHDGTLTEIARFSADGLSGSDVVYTPAGTGAVATTAQAKLRESVSPEDFGAVGDGATDDTAALRKWIAASGGTHELTEGKVYIVAPPSVGDIIIPIASGLKRIIKGNGATIKVKNASGAFTAIIGSNTLTDDLSGVKIEGVIFDHNRQSNTYTAVGGLLNYGHCTFAARKGDDIVFHKNTVKNAVSTNCIFLNGDNGSGVNQCKRPVISENTFVSIGGGAASAYDHSTIYTHADYDHVYGNKGWAESINAYGTAAFIETHGTATKVYGNFAYNFRGLANVTGIRGEGDSEYIQVYGNGGVVVEHGVRLFSGQLSPHTTGYGINGCDVFDNQIRIRQTLLEAGANYYIGVGFQPGTSLPVKDVRIFNNHVIYDEETTTSTYNVSAPAFGVMDTAGTTLFENIEIFGNTSKNAPACGVSLGMGGGQYKNCVIGPNTHVNPGSGLNPAIVSRAAIFLFGNSYTGSLTIGKQTIVDNFATTRMTYGVYSAPAIDCSSIPCTIELDIKLNGTNKAAFSHAMNNSGSRLRPLLKASVNAPLALASQTFKGGTEVFDSANDETYRILATGPTFTRHSYGSAAPTGGLYQVGSTVTNTAPSAGGTYMWVNVGAGLPGTWKPVSIAA